MENKLKLLFFDIETSPNLAYVWGQYEQNVIKQVKESEIISIAWKWLGDKKVHSLCLNDFKKDREKHLAEELHKLFTEADVLIGHNGKRFDIKMANRSFIHYGLTPPSPYKVIDTLTEAKKKFRFNSNHLNDLGEYLGLGKKVDTGGFGLWIGCMANQKKSWDLMKKYNRGDVELLEKVYLKILPWIDNHPNLIAGVLFTCPNCGGTHLQSRGWSINKKYKQRRLQCQSCGKWSLGEKVKYTI
jgi:uncharacterized protein YprB with RNaseH-like and TPR domain